MGNGRYAATLSYKDWLAFNNAQRAHYKVVEDVVPVVILQVCSGCPALDNICARL